MIKRDDQFRSMAIFLFASFVVTAVSTTTFGASTFTKIVDAANPVTTDLTPQQYTGCAWVDYDHDGLLDLFVVADNGSFTYHNLGGGAFAKILTFAMGADRTTPKKF